MSRESPLIRGVRCASLIPSILPVERETLIISQRVGRISSRCSDRSSLGSGSIDEVLMPDSLINSLTSKIVAFLNSDSAWPLKFGELLVTVVLGKDARIFSIFSVKYRLKAFTVS